MEFTKKYIIIPLFLTPNTKRRPSILMPEVKFLVAHDTGNPQSTARNNVNYYERTNNEQSASAHLFVDDKEILECVPALMQATEKAWHVRYNVTADDQLYGYNANDAAIGVEYCYGTNINADEAYKRYIWVLAYLCYTFKLDVKTSIVGHFMLDPQRRTDPVTGLAHSRRTYEQLLRDVADEYDICTGNFKDDYVRIIQAGKAITTVKLNIRQGAPDTKVPVFNTVGAGTLLDYAGWVENGALINGNARWYFDANNNYFWAGGTRCVI
jgi:N-acetylmuramoyl-L-alanine amidase